MLKRNAGKSKTKGRNRKSLLEKTTREFETLKDAEAGRVSCEAEAKAEERIAAAIEAIRKKTAEVLSGHAAWQKLKQDYTASEKCFLEAGRRAEEADAVFLREQAGLMAEKLAEGEPCPVCGSTTHPHRAVPTQGAPDEAEVRRLKAEERKTP